MRWNLEKMPYYLSNQNHTLQMGMFNFGESRAPHITHHTSLSLDMSLYGACLSKT